jgi:hypothetical protein
MERRLCRAANTKSEGTKHPRALGKACSRVKSKDHG